MESGVYAVEAKIEATHWWFVARRRLFARLLQEEPRSARVLDVGTSTGTNLRMLGEMGFTDVQGLDASHEAIAHVAEKGLGHVLHGDVCAMPFDDASFDVVLATDIIEHVDDDRGALAEIQRVLAPGGLALVTVPTFPSLWGLQDERSMHKRRYRLRQVRDRVAEAGFEVRTAYYFNYLLFVPIWLARQLLRILKPDVRSENDINNPAVNRLLTAVFTFDVCTAGRVRPPFGVSALVLARKPPG